MVSILVQWPGWAYVAEAAGMVISPPNGVFLLLPMAIISALTAFLLHRALSANLESRLPLRRISPSLPVQQWNVTPVRSCRMLQWPNRCLRGLAFGWYLNTRRWKYAIGFGVFTNLCNCDKKKRGVGQRSPNRPKE